LIPAGQNRSGGPPAPKVNTNIIRFSLWCQWHASAESKNFGLTVQAATAPDGTRLRRPVMQRSMYRRHCSPYRFPYCRDCGARPAAGLGHGSRSSRWVWAHLRESRRSRAARPAGVPPPLCGLACR
jgi:hypothetical protein